MQAFHHSGPIEPGRIYPDGDTGGMLYELVVPRAGEIILIPHGLGRPCEQYVVVKANRTIGIPYIARDAEGREINDSDRIGLVFTNILDEAPVTVRLRLA